MKSYQVILAATAVVALHGRPFAASDGALQGAAAAINKARAAADQADHRAAKTDAAAAKATAETPPAAKVESPNVEPPNVEPPTDTGGAAVESSGDDRSGDQVAARESYDPGTHRDPFMPPRLTPSQVANARTPLETYQLGQLKLVGIVAQPPESYRAMVEDSAGLGYIITTGTPIGSSGGVVRSIEPTRVIIEESTRDFYGEPKPKEVVMELPQEDRSP
jgi:hypothetical protein